MQSLDKDKNFSGAIHMRSYSDDLFPRGTASAPGTLLPGQFQRQYSSTNTMYNRNRNRRDEPQTNIQGEDHPSCSCSCYTSYLWRNIVSEIGLVKGFLALM